MTTVPVINWSDQSVKFRVFSRFDTEALSWAARSRFRLDRKNAPHLKTADPRVNAVVRAIAERRAINVKELLESFETFARLRRRLRAPVVADLCCGHGLTGLLFAAFEERVERVLLVDRLRPGKADLLIEAIGEAAPWAPAKVEWIEARLEDAGARLPDGCSVVAVHACGSRTDRAIDAALSARATAVGLLPCCYRQTAKQAPPGLRDALGAEVATDVARTYRLEGERYRVRWSAIPRAITPMNRLLVAVRRGR